MVGMLIKEAPNFFPIVVQLDFQGLEQLDQSQSQPTLGPGNRGTAAKLPGLGKDFQSLLVELWTIQVVNMQKLFPFPSPRLLEQLRLGNCCTNFQLGVAVQSSKAFRAAG